jgi:hypothetical protein
MAQVLRSICRLEQRSDLSISTLRSYVEGMGGRLHLVAEFRGRKPIEIAGFVAVENFRRKKEELALDEGVD